MATASCKILTLLILTITNAVLGITTLVLDIIFKLMGFNQIGISMGTCIDTYFLTKYSFLITQLKASFICVCISVLACSIVLVFIILTFIKFKEQTKTNPQIQKDFLSSDVLSRTTYAIIYIFQTLMGLGIVVVFGYYLTFLIDMSSLICPFSYYPSDFIIQIIISGIWLLIFLVSTYVLFILVKYQQEEQKNIKKQKYMQMVNVTQQPQALQHKDELYDRKYNNNNNNNTQENLFEGSNLNTSNNHKNSFPSIFTLNATHQHNPVQRDEPQKLNIQDRYNKPSNERNERVYQKKQTYQEYKQRQIKEAIMKQNPNQNSNNPNSFINPKNDILGSLSSNKLSNEEDEGGNNLLKQQINLSRPKNNNRQFNEPIKYNNKPVKESRIVKNNPSQFEKSPLASFRNNVSKREEGDQDTRGQLVFYKRGNQKSRIDKDYNQFQSKSPSRFESNFIRQEQQYLKKNARGPVLPPNNNVQELSPQRAASRRGAFEESSYNNDTFKDSKYKQSNVSQSRSRGKSREGVLTNFIRGKFN